MRLNIVAKPCDSQTVDRAGKQFFYSGDIAVWKPDGTLLLDCKRGAADKPTMLEVWKRGEELDTSAAFNLEDHGAKFTLCRRAIQDRLALLGIELPAYNFATVNLNRVTPPHVDNQQGVSGCVTGIRGIVKGCELVFPEWGVGVALKNGDVTLADFTELHGNAPADFRDGTRVNVIMWCRSGDAPNWSRWRKKKK